MEFTSSDGISRPTLNSYLMVDPDLRFTFDSHQAAQLRPPRTPAHILVMKLMQWVSNHRSTWLLHKYTPFTPHLLRATRTKQFTTPSSDANCREPAVTRQPAKSPRITMSLLDSQFQHTFMEPNREEKEQHTCRPSLKQSDCTSPELPIQFKASCGFSACSGILLHLPIVDIACTTRESR